ncbi:hypothetical protein SCACP_21630 [Sporomusa carbonis]|uniref:DUF1351 domain-containing protein n=1 Tax=Sporomusa carbonis TaxID=3076075 RepID=UPI003A6552A0
MSDPLEIDITGTMETVSENAKSVLDNDETVTVSTEIVNESAPAVIELEPKTTSLIQEFDWNFAEIKQAIQQRIEKYVGLVVTEDNLKDMEDTQKEIAGLRAKIDAFRKQVKKQLNEPYDKFEGQVKELLAIVEQAEGPLRKQILQYEEDRRKAKETELLEFGRKTAANLGVRDEYFNLVIPAKWTNRTAKDGAVRKEIVTEVEYMLARQRKDDEAAELERQKTELITQLCANTSQVFMLKTPLTPEDIQHLTANAGLAEIPGIITKECTRRAELERKAAAPPPVLELSEYGSMSASPEPEPEYSPEYLPPEPPRPQLPPMPPPPRMEEPPLQPPFQPATAPAPALWDVQILLTGKSVTVQQAARVRQCMEQNGFIYEVISQERVK